MAIFGCLFLAVAFPGSVAFIMYLVIKTLGQEKRQRQQEAIRDEMARQRDAQTWPPPPQAVVKEPGPPAA